jgi:hypothetical protein
MYINPIFGKKIYPKQRHNDIIRLDDLSMYLLSYGAETSTNTHHINRYYPTTQQMINSIELTKSKD